MVGQEQQNPPPQRQENRPVEHIAIKAPEFMEAAPAAWFSIIEAQFELKSITLSSTKYFNALSNLPASVVTLIPPSVFESKDYEILKQSVVSSYEKSKPEILEKLMSQTTLTGRPSVFLQEMMSQATKINVGEDKVRHKFIQALPQSISPVIAAQSSLSIEALGKLADDLLPYFSTNANINAVYHQHGRYNSNSRNDNRRSHSRPDNSTTSNLPFGFKPFAEDQRPKICRAHLYFGTKAKNCKPWCHWPNKSNFNILPASRPSSRSSSPVNSTN